MILTYDDSGYRVQVFTVDSGITIPTIHEVVKLDEDGNEQSYMRPKRIGVFA